MFEPCAGSIDLAMLAALLITNRPLPEMRKKMEKKSQNTLLANNIRNDSFTFSNTELKSLEAETLPDFSHRPQPTL
jgi:hypothetical protein